MSIKDIMAHAYTQAKAIIEGGNEAITVFLAEHGNGELGIYGAPWANDDEKDAALRAVRILFHCHGVERYVSVGEAWSIARHRDDCRPDMPRPSQCEDRKEVLMILGVERDRSIAAYADIDRHADGTRTCGPMRWQPPQETTSSGRMSNLLPDPAWPKFPAGTTDIIEAMFGIKPNILH